MYSTLAIERIFLIERQFNTHFPVVKPVYGLYLFYNLIFINVELNTLLFGCLLLRPGPGGGTQRLFVPPPTPYSDNTVIFP